MSGDDARAELRAIYTEIDALLAPYSCDGSFECCEFDKTGREPYPTAVELAEIERAMAAASIDARTRPARRRGLPLAGDAGRCPLLSHDGRCRIYVSRPFGCRTFFCERMSGPGKLPAGAIRDASRRIAALSERFAPRDPGPRPLTRALK